MYKKSIKIQLSDSSIDCSILAKEIVDNLTKVHARNVEIIGSRITFKGSVLSDVSSWNILIPISHGEIVIDPTNHSLQYSISFSQTIIEVTIGLVIMGIFALCEGIPMLLIVFALPVGWLWLVGMNILIGIPRFDSFIKQIVISAGFYVI